MLFTKMQGAGNDFIILDDRTGEIGAQNYSSLAASLCRRRLSLGADGMIIVVEPTDGGDYAMLFFNSDGTMGEMCGNGARCIARYGHDHGLSGDVQRIETTAGIVTGRRVSEDRYTVRLNDPSVIRLNEDIPLDGKTVRCSYVELGDPGIPHAVTELPGWSEMDRRSLGELGKKLRYHSAFPKGANVTFYERVGPGHVRAITYERGVEDFTLACGTGAGSTAAVLRRLGLSEGDLILDFPGGRLEVSVSEDGDSIRDIFLTGPAVTVAEGEIVTV